MMGKWMVVLALVMALGKTGAFRAPVRTAGRALVVLNAEADPNKARYMASEGPKQKGTRRQQIKFVIRGPVVEMEVSGAVGDECLKITEGIEEALGEVIHREDKPERWQQQVVEEDNTIFEQKFSEW